MLIFMGLAGNAQIFKTNVHVANTRIDILPDGRVMYISSRIAGVDVPQIKYIRLSISGPGIKGTISRPKPTNMTGATAEFVSQVFLPSDYKPEGNYVDIKYEIQANGKPGFTTRRRVEVLKSNKQGDPNKK